MQSVNAAESRIYGFEAELDWLIGDYLDVLATLRYTYGEQSVGGVDEPADRIPPLSGRLSVTYATGGSYSAKAWIAFADEQDRLSARDIRDVRIDPKGTPGWGTIGISGQWQSVDGWSLSLGVDNLLDKRYRSHGSGIDAPGRNLSISVRRRW